MKNQILSKVIKENTLLPNRIFCDNIHFVTAFEPALIYDDFFFESLSSYIKNSSQKNIIAGELIGDKLFTLDVNNINYDYWIENVLSQDGLFYTETGITSDSANWALYIDNVDFEIGLAGFSSKKQENLFFESFGKESDIFTPLAEYIANMDSVLNFSNEIKEKYNNIIKKHTLPDV